MEIIERVYDAVFAPTNATSGINGFDSITGVGGIIVLVAIAVGVLAILFTISADISKYRRFKNLLTSLSKTFSYCAFGMLTVAVIGVPVYLGYLGINQVGNNPEGAIIVGKWVGIIVGCFIGFTLVGYATKNRVWKRIYRFHKQEKQIQDNIKELPGMIE